MSEFDPQRPDFAPYGFSFTRWTPQPMRRADRHNEIELNLLTGGTITYLLGGRRVTLPPGRLAVFWAAMPHQVVEVEASEAYYVVTVPLIWFLQRQLPAGFVHAIMTGGVIIEADADDDARRIGRWVDDMARHDTLRQRVVFLELEARLLRLAVSSRTTADDALPPAAPADGYGHVERMLSVIATGYTGRITVDQIVGPTGLHPNYAMALFKKLFGMTLLDCLTQHRVTHAQRLLVTGEQSVAAIAMESGFVSVSRFNDAFKRTCGRTPREFRRAHATA